jgi:Flp pilus assembly protein TadD
MERAQGMDDAAVGVLLVNLGNVQLAQGDLSGARETVERSVRIGEATRPSADPELATRYGNLAFVLMEQGDLAGARALCERALELTESALGPNHPLVGIRRENLGSVLWRQGDLVGAREQRWLALDHHEHTG